MWDCLLAHRSVWPIVVSWTLMLAAACGDECTPGESRCFHGDVQVCEANECEIVPCGSDYSFRSQGSCGGTSVCVMPGEHAFCTFSDQPEPLCKLSAQFCHGQEIWTCDGDYLTGKEDCRNYDMQCVEGTGRPFCALVDSQSAVCDQDARQFRTEVCRDAKSLFGCQEDWPVSFTACTGYCVEPPYHEAICALDPDPESRCQAEGQQIADPERCPDSDGVSVCNAGYLSCRNAYGQSLSNGQVPVLDAGL